MIKVNLLPEELRVKEARKFELPPFVSPKGLLYFLAALVCIEVLLMIHLILIAEPRFDRLQKEYRSLGSPLTEVRGIKEKVSAIQDVDRSLQRWMHPPISWTALLTSLVNGMEKGVWLTHFKFERREFDAPELPEPPPTPAKNTKVSGKQAVAAKPAPQRPAARPPARKPGVKEKRVVLVLTGRVSVDREEAAVVGGFLQSLKSQPALMNLVENFSLDQIRRDTSSEIPIFDFVVLGVVRRDLEKEFYNLS